MSSNFINISEMGNRGKAAANVLAVLSTRKKNETLLAIAGALENNVSQILACNAGDLENAVKCDMSISMQDRLMLNERRIRNMADAVRQIAAMDDPIGQIVDGQIRPNGLYISKVRVPLGLVGMIYEARPNVTVDAAALCLKAGNAIILRGGKEAVSTNRILTDIMRKSLEETGLPADSIQTIADTRRESVQALIGCRDLDVLIPRGGAGLIRTCMENAKVPVIQTGVGNCHLYVDASADLEMAVQILDNAKTSRPSVCNAVESLLVHQDVAESFLPLAKARLDHHRVEWRGCPQTRKILGGGVEPASDEDYAAEFLNFVLSCRVVPSMEEALRHIRRYSTGHSEAIVTRDLASARRFQREIDAAAIYVNASTRFTDGGEFGLGAEIGISTQKLHARGPMGVQALTTIKYLIIGEGQIR